MNKLPIDLPDSKGLTRAKKVAEKFERLKGQRTNWDSYWETLSEYFIPNKDDVYGFRMGGENKFNRLYDSTSVQSLELLAAHLHGMMTNPSAVWFNMSTGDSDLDMDEEVQEYIHKCTTILIDKMNGSNFQEEIHDVYIDLGGIGTTVLDILEDEIDDVRYKSRPIYSSYIDENYRGVVDTLYRKEEMSLRNIRDKFGEDVFKYNDSLKQQLEKTPDAMETLIYAVEPDENKKGKFIGYWVLAKNQILLKEEMFNSWPFAVPRWTKLNSEKYGRAPSMKCLPDVRMLNAMMKTTIRGMQKAVDPPMMVPDNGFLLPLNTTPGGSNFYRAGMKDRIELFPTGARPDVAEEFMEGIRRRIREAFYTDQIQLINQRDMTATEVMQRTDESLRFLGPILGRLNNELLKPIIDRTFDILARRGRFPQAPEALRDNANLKIIYTSQIAKAQRTGEANTLNKVIQVCMPIIQSQPDVMDNFNGDAILKYNAANFGLPPEFLNKDKEVKATREARAKAQQEAQQAQQENVNADTAQKQAQAQQG